MTRSWASLAAGSEPWIRWGLDGVFVVLAAVGAIRDGTPVAFGIAAGLVAWDLVGAIWLRSRGPGWAVSWLVVLAASWALVTLLGQSGFAWLAFPLFFFHLFILPLPIGLLAVAATTLVVIVGLDMDGGFRATDILGPVLGAFVAVGGTMAYRALVAENRRSRELLAELVRARERLASTERQRGVLEERRRLAREVHDTIAQGLSSIILLARAETMASDRASDRVTQIGQVAQQNLDEARRIVTALGPTSSDESSLGSEIRVAVDVANKASSVAFDVTVVGEVTPISPAAEFALLRVAQGAVANVVAHSEAAQAEVTLSYDETEIILEVVDDGAGFDLERPVEQDGSGYGLRFMRERLAAVGGGLTIDSRPGAGTRVTATVPRAPR